jgi:hypothetical protein
MDEPDSIAASPYATPGTAGKNLVFAGLGAVVVGLCAAAGLWPFAAAGVVFLVFGIYGFVRSKRVAAGTAKAPPLPNEPWSTRRSLWSTILSTTVAVLFLSWGVVGGNPVALLFGALWMAFALASAYRLANGGAAPISPRSPDGAPVASTGFNWRILIGLLVGVPLLIAIVGAVDLAFFSDSGKTAVGKCVTISNAAPSQSDPGFTIATLAEVPCGGQHDAKIVSAVDDSKNCPDGAHAYFGGGLDDAGHADVCLQTEP